MGSGAFGCDSLRWLHGSAHEVVRVMTQPARPAGRGKKVVHTPIAQLSEELGLAVVESGDVNAAELVAEIVGLRPEAIVVIAFGQKLGAELLNVAGCRVINLHGSLLPRYRGAAPINWAIINGEQRAGVTIIELNEVWDGGAMLGQAGLEIGPSETAGELHDRMAHLGPGLIGKVLDDILAGRDEPITQDHGIASRAPKLRKSDGAIDWCRPAEEVCRRINGMWPWPGAYCVLRQAERKKAERVTVARAELAEGSVGAHAAAEPAGTVTGELTVACGSGRVRLLAVRPENGKLMSFGDFVNGRQLRAGGAFENGQQ